MTTRVLKRNGVLVDVSPNEVLNRINFLCGRDETKEFGPLEHVNCFQIAQEVIAGISDGISTSQLDDLAANIAYPMVDTHPDYDELAARLLISNYHKNNIHNLLNCHKGLTTDEIQKHNFYYVCKAMFGNANSGKAAPLLAPDIFAFVSVFRSDLEKMIDYDRDYQYDYFGFKTLHKSYLNRVWINDPTVGGMIWTQIERPQHMIMRIAVGLHATDKYHNWDEELHISDEDVWAKINSQINGIKRKNPNANIPDLSCIENKIKLNTIIKESNKSKFTKFIHEHGDIEFDRYVHEHGEVEESIPWDKLNNIFRAHKDTNTIDICNIRGLKRSQDYGFSDVCAGWELQRLIYEGHWKFLNVEEKGKIEGILKKIAETYKYMSLMYFTHATPTLFNCGSVRPQLSSCYLMTVSDDIEGITKYWSDISQVSKWAGGIGTSVHNIRSTGSYIAGTNGTSNGLRPLMKVVNEISLYIDQGGNKRPGSNAIYLEPWHADIESFLDLKKQRGTESQRARSLFYAMWINDEFMRCIEREAETGQPEWYLMDPRECSDLANVYDNTLSIKWLNHAEATEENGFAFTHKYRNHIIDRRYVKCVSARELWKQICDTIVETGIPYMLMKDSCNRKSNQKHIGTIRSSNLCTEIVEFSAPDEIAVCNLASICLPKFVRKYDGGKTEKIQVRTPYYNVSIRNDEAPVNLEFNWKKLQKVIRIIVRNLDKVIDINYYPVNETKRSNMRHRPMGIGVQGLADLFSMLRIGYSSAEAQKLSFHIFECIYYTSLDESANIAHEKGSYPTFKGSPLHQGFFQQNLWEDEQKTQGNNPLKFLPAMDWDYLKTKVKNGVRNSLFVAPMPTGTTSNIMGNSPCFEPHNSLIYKRRTKAGEFAMTNKAFIRDMISLGLWTSEVRDALKIDRCGSIGSMMNIPQKIREIYPTVWDISLREQIDCALVRAPFIDQSQSFSIFIERPTVSQLSQGHFYGWRRGIKTSSYYTRRLAPTDAQKLQLEGEKSVEACTADCKDCSA